MGRLTEVVKEYVETGIEIHEEGVNIVAYWAARCNIDEEELVGVLRALFEVIQSTPSFEQLGDESKATGFLVQGFIIGVMYGMTKGDDEL